MPFSKFVKLSDAFQVFLHIQEYEIFPIENNLQDGRYHS
jgi:hypothetical protein